MLREIFQGRFFTRCKLAYVLAGLALLAVAISSPGCGDTKDAVTTENTAATTTATDELTEDWLASRAASKIGSANLLRKVTITDTGGDKQVLIEVDRPEVCHDGAVVGTVAVFAQNMMGILYKKYPEVANVEIVMYGIEQGVVSDEVAMKIAVNRESAQAIDWFSFDETNMFQLATSYYMHPKIEESFRLEGALPYDQQT